MIAERSHYKFSHTAVLYLDADLRIAWHSQDKYAMGFALDTHKRYVEGANRYPLLGGCNVTTHTRSAQAAKEAPSGFSF